MIFLTQPMIVAGGVPSIRFWAGRDFCDGPRSFGIAISWGLRSHVRYGEIRYRHCLAAYFAVPRIVGFRFHLERY